VRLRVLGTLEDFVAAAFAAEAVFSFARFRGASESETIWAARSIEAMTAR
jgi:hypothetical protein